jgi:hypothetical protein
MRSNMVLYGPPPARPKGKKGAPAKHGAQFKLSHPSRSPDRTETFTLGQQSVSLQVWQGLHFKKLAPLVGMVVRVEFLRPDGTPRYKRPMWLFWTVPDTVALKWMWLCAMAYWQLLLTRDEIPYLRPAWYSTQSVSEKRRMTPGQVQRGALRFLVQIGTPALPTRTAGKGKGRKKDYLPAPRERFPAVKKAKMASNRTARVT